MSATCECPIGTECFYCDRPITMNHEHDHMPIPVRHGGVETVPACPACHALKDRLKLDNWGAEQVFAGWRDMSPTGRILLARVYALSLDMRRDAEAGAA